MKQLLLVWFFLLLAEGGLSFSGLFSSCVENARVRTGWRGLAQGPTCNQPFHTGFFLAARPFSVVPTPCSSSRRSALLRLVSSGPVSDGGAEERDQASGQLEAAEGKANAGKEELKSAEGKLEIAEGKLEAAKEELKAAKEELKAANEEVKTAECKLEAATDPQQKALAQKACGRADKAYELAVKNVNTARENVNTARENVNTARENVNRAGRAVDIALDALKRAGSPLPATPRAQELIASPTAFTEFLDSNSIRCRTAAARRARPSELVNDQRYAFVGRQQVLESVLKGWLDRFVNFRRLAPTRHKLDKAQLVVLPSAPGMGKSRILSVLACNLAAADSVDEFGDREAKELALAAVKCQDADLLREFRNYLRGAAAVCLSFNGASARAVDQREIPQARHALLSRLLWSHFCPDVEYSRFVQVIKDPVQQLSLGLVLDLLLSDVGNTTHLIVCVDELLLVRRGDSPGWEQVSAAVAEVLSEFSDTLDSERRVHVVFSSLSEQPILRWQTATMRYAEPIPLPRLSRDEARAMWGDRHLETGEDAKSVKRRAVVEQLVEDCAGAPRVLERLDRHLESEGITDLVTVQHQMWRTQLGSLWNRLDMASLPHVLAMVLSGENCSRPDMESYTQMGLFLQSPATGSLVPEVPPLVLGMLHQRRFGGLAGRMLDAVSEFMLLDKLTSDAREAFRDFELQMAHLLRLRLFVLEEKGRTHFSLVDLLFVEGQAKSQLDGTVWRRTGSSSDDAPLYKLPLDSDVGVFILNDEQIVDAASRSTLGAIYIPRRANFPGADLFVHLPSGELIAVQVRLSAQDANNVLGVSDVQQALGSFCKASACAELLPMTAAFVVLARREAAQSLSMKAIRPSEYVWETCKEVYCLADHDLMRIVPFSLRLRPNLQIFMHSE